MLRAPPGRSGSSPRTPRRSSPPPAGDEARGFEGREPGRPFGRVGMCPCSRPPAPALAPGSPPPSSPPACSWWTLRGTRRSGPCAGRSCRSWGCSPSPSRDVVSGTSPGGRRSPGPCSSRGSGCAPRSASTRCTRGSGRRSGTSARCTWVLCGVLFVAGHALDDDVDARLVTGGGPGRHRRRRRVGGRPGTGLERVHLAGASRLTGSLRRRGRPPGPRCGVVLERRTDVAHRPAADGHGDLVGHDRGRGRGGQRRQRRQGHGRRRRSRGPARPAALPAVRGDRAQRVGRHPRRGRPAGPVDGDVPGGHLRAERRARPRPGRWTSCRASRRAAARPQC